MNSEILLVDKPAGMSSFGVVARVRRKLSEAAGTIAVQGKDGTWREKRRKVKVGHTGTLDPFATGLLILLTGKATKRAGEFLKLDKEYITTIKLGYTSSTGDVEGEIRLCAPRAAADDLTVMELDSSGGRGSDSLDEESAPLTGKLSDAALGGGEMTPPSLAQVEEVIQSFIGEIEQTVPNFSAVKINGQRAYKLAREGKLVEMPRRKVRIYELQILRYEWPELELHCKVSSGTYIRTLGEDIGQKLGVGGYLTALRRTQVGPYRIEESKTLAELGIEEG